MGRNVLIQRCAWATLIVGIGVVAIHPGLRKKSGLGAVWHTYEDAMQSVQEKVDDLKRAQTDNDRLRIENANLRIQLDSLNYTCTADMARKTTEIYALKIHDDKADNRLRRAIAGIAYRPPDHLLPEQLHSLGVSYFKAKEDEKAAVILSQLANMDDEVEFQSPSNLLMTGVAWYRAGMYEVAEDYFARVVRSTHEHDAARINELEADKNIDPDTKKAKIKEAKEAEEARRKSNERYVAAARLWRALASEKLNQFQKSQAHLVDLVDHHPRAKETAWVNGGGIAADASSAHHHQPTEHHEGHAAPAAAEKRPAHPEHPVAASGESGHAPASAPAHH